MKNKKVFMARILLIVFCAVIASACIIKISETYDPLARYPYVDESNRNIILEHLNEDDIDYLITQKIKPDQFLDFIEEPEFKIHNTLFYSLAKKVQNENNAYIVNFMNKYRDQFSLNEWKTALKNYSYMDLMAFFETDLDQSKLVLEPSRPYTILNASRSIYKYIPQDIVSYGDVFVKEELVKHLQEMQVDYHTMMNGNDGLHLLSGYMTYEDIMNTHINLENELGKDVIQFALPAGHNEQQLGYTIVLSEAKEWNRLCMQEKTYETFDYQNVYLQLSPELIDKLNWIKNNAYQYGFVVRYPEGKEEQTHQEYQPFVLRYVGVDTAKKMFESNKVLEQMKGLDELE